MSGQAPQWKQCPRCGQVAPLNAFKCEKCGREYRTTAPLPPAPPEQTQYLYTPAPQPPPPARPDFIQLPPGAHSIVPALLLAALIGGWAGALHNRQYLKGVVLLLVTIGVTLSIGVSAWVCVWIVGILDSLFVAQRLHRGEAVGQWQFF